MSLEGCFLPSEQVACTPVSHSGNKYVARDFKRRHVGHEAKINKSFDDNNLR